MAETKNKNQEIAELGERLFAAKRSMPRQSGAQQDAVLSLREARIFIDARSDFESGKLDTRTHEGPELSDCSCPNEKKTHPHNLVSKRFGNLERVKKVLAELEADKRIEAYESGDISWSVSQTNLARLIFPAYAGANN